MKTLLKVVDKCVKKGYNKYIIKHKKRRYKQWKKLIWD